MTKLTIGILAVALSQLSFAQVQKCQDSRTGAVTYSDEACPTGTKPQKAIPIDVAPTPKNNTKGIAKPSTRTTDSTSPTLQH